MTTQLSPSPKLQARVDSLVTAARVPQPFRFGLRGIGYRFGTEVCLAAIDLVEGAVDGEWAHVDTAGGHAGGGREVYRRRVG